MSNEMDMPLVRNLLGTRDGRIFIGASIAYLILGISAKVLPGVASTLGFVGFVSFFMPPLMLLMLLKVRIYKASFRPSWFSTAAVSFAALLPFLVIAKRELLK